MSEEIEKLKFELLNNPEVVLEDLDVMRALLHAHDDSNGEKVVDLRNVFVERLEDRLDKLENTHQIVIKAAYDNMSGTSQVQRAVLAALEPRDFPGFLDAVQNEVGDILAIDVARLCIESKSSDGPLPHAVITPLSQGAINEYITQGRDVSVRKITLRTAPANKALIYTAAAGRVKSEALMRLDLGQKQLPALLALGSTEEDRFSGDQGVDLLQFFSVAFERILRRWVA